MVGFLFSTNKRKKRMQSAALAGPAVGTVGEPLCSCAKRLNIRRRRASSTLDERGMRLEALTDLLRAAGSAAVDLFTLPYFYIAVALVCWQAKTIVRLQRKMFHVRMYGTVRLAVSRLLAGLAAGAALSVAGLGIGAALNAETLAFVWVAMIVLALLRLRYICLAYGAGAVALLRTLAEWTGVSPDTEPWRGVLEALLKVDAPGVLLLAGALHIAEGLLVRLQGPKLAVPLFLQGKRGLTKGAYALSGLWPVPLLWLAPAGAGGFALPWTPLLGLDGANTGWTLLAFPVLIGFSDRTSAHWPEAKAKFDGQMLMIYGVVVAVLAAGAAYWPGVTALAALAAFGLHEGLLLLGRFRESGRAQLYSQDGTGVKILAVLPGTPAAEMGLLAGETIRKANGAATRTKEELHAALELQSAYCKLEVANRDGEVKFVQRARYEGEHYQLGLILAPDDAVEYVAAPHPSSLWQGLRNAGARRYSHAPGLLAELEAKKAEAEMAAAIAAREAAERQAAAPPAPGLPPRSSKLKGKE